MTAHMSAIVQDGDVVLVPRPAARSLISAGKAQAPGPEHADAVAAAWHAHSDPAAEQADADPAPEQAEQADADVETAVQPDNDVETR